MFANYYYFLLLLFYWIGEQGCFNMKYLIRESESETNEGKIAKTVFGSLRTVFAFQTFGIWFSAVCCFCNCDISLRCCSLPSPCRKTMAVRWFARNMSAKSSWAWASNGQSVHHHSLHFLSTLLSTLSGYTKCSNFTPVWRGTEGVVWKQTPRRGAHFGAPYTTREKWGQSLYGKWPFWDFVNSPVFQRGQS